MKTFYINLKYVHCTDGDATLVRLNARAISLYLFIIIAKHIFKKIKFNQDTD